VAWGAGECSPKLDRHILIGLVAVGFPLMVLSCICNRLQYMGRVARTYRLDPELVLRVEGRAEALGQSLTVFVSRALESALGGGQSSVGRGVASDDQQVSTPGSYERPGRAQGPVGRGGESGVPAGQQRRSWSGHAMTCKCAVCKPVWS